MNTKMPPEGYTISNVLSAVRKKIEQYCQGKFIDHTPVIRGGFDFKGGCMITYHPRRPRYEFGVRKKFKSDSINSPEDLLKQTPDRIYFYLNVEYLKGHVTGCDITIESDLENGIFKKVTKQRNELHDDRNFEEQPLEEAIDTILKKDLEHCWDDSIDYSESD